MMSKTEKIQAELAELQARQGAAAAKLQEREDRLASERQAAREKLALALADGDDRQAKAAERELEQLNAAERELERLRLEAEGLALRAARLQEQLKQAEAEQEQAYRAWLERRAEATARVLLESGEQLRQALAELHLLSHWSEQRGGVGWLSNGLNADAPVPRHHVFAPLHEARRNLLFIPPHELEAVREKLRAEARAAGVA